MQAKIILIGIEGNLKGQRFEFDSRTTCIIGRASDCNPKIPDDEYHRTISRYHCFLDINPPNICVRDFGSLNGTFVNGEKIGQRERHQTPEEVTKQPFPQYDLRDGDEIKLSHTVFKISVELHSEVKANQSLPVTISYPEIGLKLSQNVSNFISIQGYTTLRKLGKGGMGEVYLAQNDKTGEQVALKVTHSQIHPTQRIINLFLREVENTRALNHPNVVKLLDDGYSNDTFFFTLEYCNAGSVYDLMNKRRGKLPLDEAIPIILQVLDGLEYAHNAEIPYVRLKDGTFGWGQGLVHRDLKPANIFLSNINGNLVAKVGDYGLAKAFDLAGLSGHSMTGKSMGGTVPFMCRQQVLDFKYAKPEVDIWAAAAALYNMITGTYSRNFTSEKDPLLVILTEPAVPIRQRHPSIPKPLAELLDFALTDNPEIPFKTAAEFKKALENAL